MSQQPGNSIEPAYAAAMPAPQGGALPTGLEWQALERMAHTLADSDVIPYRLKRKPADVAVVLLAAREYGIPPLMALSKLPVVNGTPAPMGELMVALVLRAGHSIRVRIEGEGGNVTDLVALCTTRRRGEAEDDVLRFTFREAVDAGLVSLRDGKPYARDDKDRPTPWELYTVNMLRWRAVANACRLRFPDVLLGLSYLPEELGATVDAEGAPVVGEVVDEAPRRRTTTTASLEERSAQEAADRLVDFVGPLTVLDGVEKHANDNGYGHVEVTYLGDRMPLESAIDVRRAVLRELLEEAQAAADLIHHGTPVEVIDELEAQARALGYLEAPIVVGGVDGTLDAYLRYARDQLAKPAEERDVVDEQPAEEAAQPAEEAPADPPATEEAAEPVVEPQEAAQQPGPGQYQGPPDTDRPGATQPLAGPDLALELARSALDEADPETLRSLWRMADEAGVLDVDVLPVVGDDDLAAIDLQNTVRLPLRGLLIAANGYVGRHARAIRDVGV